MADNGWNEYQRLVLAELQRLDTTVKQVQTDVTAIHLAVAVLRTRAVTWGALGGLGTWGVALLLTTFF